ncbi:unnamed protein product [Caenorhabditis auriculariae]|uniref:Uncharacterized protein n=1 Tax=Caenorhabditis auriculariae TaxID=2777116 RepID=A0A8S1HJL7_9PELO|nr:unnamed protein product [Caenorhabditis auriculariae]
MAKPAYARVKHLHEVATSISMLGTSKDDGYAKISRHISKTLREVLDRDRMHVESSLKRAFCRKCREVLVGKIEKSEISFPEKNVVRQTCCRCQNYRNYMTLRGYGQQLKEQHLKIN